MNDVSPTAAQHAAHRADSVRILLVRHGETRENRQAIVQGQHPRHGRLTPEGIRQARALGEALATRPLDAVYCSPLERAVLTMSLVLVARRGEGTRPIVFADALREIRLGALEGRPRSEWKAAMAGQDPVAFRPAGGECWLDVQARATRFLFDELLPAGHSDVLIVAHGGINRGLLASLTGLSMAEAWHGEGVGFPQDNTCVNDLLLDRRGRLLDAVVNDTSHLAGLHDGAAPGRRWIGGAERWAPAAAMPAPAAAREFDPYG